MAYPAMVRSRGLPALWNDLFSPRGDVNRFFEGFDGEGFSVFGGGSFPAVDVQETEDEIRLLAELPGLTAKDVKVTVENGILSITGEKNRTHEEGDENSTFHLVERKYGRFARSFSLPKTADAEKVRASFDNGVLTIALAKVAAAKPKQIPIG